MSQSVEFVDTQAALEAAISKLMNSSLVAVDTEFIRRDTFFPIAGLIQLADDHACFLVDPLALADMTPLVELLECPSIIKIMHACSEDLEVFRHLCGALPCSLFDTQIAAGYCDLPFSLGYQKLVQALLGIELDKGETQSDWLRRPLYPKQLQYAAADVLYLPRIYRELHARLSGQQRLQWVEQDCSDIVDAAREPAVPDSGRIKGAANLPRRGLAWLERLLVWREERAVMLDKPRTWILSDQQCLAIVRGMSADASVLSSYAKLGRGRPERVAVALAAQLEDVMALPDSELPAALPGRPDAVTTAQIKKMKAQVRTWSEEWQVASEQLLRNKDYAILAKLISSPATELPPRLSGWRSEVLVEPLMKTLRQGMSVA